MAVADDFRATVGFETAPTVPGARRHRRHAIEQVRGMRDPAAIAARASSRLRGVADRHTMSCRDEVAHQVDPAGHRRERDILTLDRCRDQNRGLAR